MESISKLARIIDSIIVEEYPRNSSREMSGHDMCLVTLNYVRIANLRLTKIYTCIFQPLHSLVKVVILRYFKQNHIFKYYVMEFMISQSYLYIVGISINISIFIKKKK